MNADQAARPSAPVGVAGLADKWLSEMGDQERCSEAHVLQTCAEELRSALAQQPAADAHCTTCSCVPGMTPAVRFDATPAEKDGAVRDHLIHMGWTPPAEAQVVDDEARRLRAAIVTYLEARQIYEAATAALNPHAPERRLPHGSTVARLYREARAELDRAVDP